MKKLLSIILVVALLCGISAIGTSAATADVATTQTQQFFYSDEPFQNVEPVNGYVYGFIGDTDGDGDISVLDATEIQKWIAQLSELTDDGYLLSDVDMDDDISVLDATEIQKWIAQLSTNPYISYTLYSEDFIEITFDEIAQYIKTYGEYDSEDGYYFTYNYYEEYSMDLMLAYYPQYDEIDLYGTLYLEDTEVFTEVLMSVYRGNPVFSFYTTTSDLNTVYYTAIGEGELIDMNPDNFDVTCDTFESDYGLTFGETYETTVAGFTALLELADLELYNYIDGFVRDIFW